MSIEAGLLIPITMLLNRLVRGLLPLRNRDPINVDNDDLIHKALEAHQRKNYMEKDNHKILLYLLQLLQ